MPQTTRPIDLIVVHHSASPDTTTPDQIGAWHRERGFSSIGYHYIIYDGDDGATIARGRPESRVGAHCKGSNARSIGICVCGSYEDGAPVRDDLWQLLVSTVEGICSDYDLSADCVYGHRERARAGHPTACPGYSADRLRLDVAELAAQGAKAMRICSSPTCATVHQRAGGMRTACVAAEETQMRHIREQ